ncbi:Rap1a/Tai family immunity protein [Thalassotalea agariperforans]
MKMNKILSLILFTFFIASFQVKASFKTELIEACKRYQQNVKAEPLNGCKLYIDGFIDSAVLSENAVILSTQQLANNQKKSDFIKRVYQTRLNNGLESKNVSYQFCIPQELTRQTITSEVAKLLNIDDLNKKEFKQVVFEALVAKFPCR